MKRPLACTLIAAPLLTLSSMVFASEPISIEPIALTENQMDSVTAGTYERGSWRPAYPTYKWAQVVQINASPVTIIQIGNNNYAVVYSGNFLFLHQ
jgi:hypothetical protein